uniref:H(+)-transporting two-sector ATPase n=1 Tax=Gossypium raimondii TaxID=29730 RepID=A0A0D2QHW0_GOSRA|nr:hypothetical protein B456_001G196000 [Gossypium raimondii]
MSSAVGYQPTISTRMGFLQEIITSTKEGSITSIQAVYVLADDLIDLAPATTFVHLDATTVLSRGLATKGIYPEVNPLDSMSTMLQHYKRCFCQDDGVMPNDVRNSSYELNSALGTSSRNYAKTRLIVSTSVCDLRNQDDAKINLRKG